MRASVLRELIFNIITFVIVVAVASAYLAIYVYRWNPLEKTTTVTMNVKDTNLILDKTGVFISGVRVGAVSAIDLNPNGAAVKLTFPASTNLPSTTPVEIGMQSALGEPYINFMPTGVGTGPYLRDGDTVKMEHLNEPESIPAVFEHMQNMMNVVAVDPLATVLRESWISLRDTDEATGRISDGTRLLAGVFASRIPQVRKMFEATQQYNQNLLWAAGTMPDFVNNLSKIIVSYTGVLHGAGVLNYDNLLYNTLHGGIDPFLVKLTAYLEKLLPPTLEAVGPIMPIVTALNDTLPQINLSMFLSDALQLFGAGNGMRVVVTPVN